MTIVPKMNFAISSNRQLLTEDMNISENTSKNNITYLPKSSLFCGYR